MMLVALFMSTQVLVKLGDPCEITVIELDPIFVTENTQPENTMMFWELTDLL